MQENSYIRCRIFPCPAVSTVRGPSSKPSQTTRHTKSRSWKGRRAIGKSTLARHLVDTGIYASYQTLADPTERANAAADPTRWLASLDFPAIIDEAQLVPT